MLRIGEVETAAAQPGDGKMGIMRRLVWLPGLVVILSQMGCHGLNIATSNRVKMDPVEASARVAIQMASPVHTINKVVMDMPPVPDAGPLLPVPLPGGTAVSAVGPGPRIAVVDVDGVLLNREYTGFYSLGENPVALFRERLETVAADPHVKAVVVRINSPGGSVTATDILWHELQSFRHARRLPVVACLLDVAAGGGYYLATASDAIVAHPTTVTGGIGVILNLFN